MDLSDSQKSSLLFTFGCIPARVLLVYLAYLRNTSELKWLTYFPAITLAIGIGFLILYFTGIRKSGAETFGKPIWWNKLRLYHGILFIAYSVAAINDCDFAPLILLFDLGMGIGGFIQK